MLKTVALTFRSGMPVEQMNISLPPKMARFIRSQVRGGQYTDASEVVRDAMRHMQDAQAAKVARIVPDETANSEESDPGIARRVRQDIHDIDSGRFNEYDADGLRSTAKEFVLRSAKRRSSGTKAG